MLDIRMMSFCSGESDATGLAMVSNKERPLGWHDPEEPDQALAPSFQPG